MPDLDETEDVPEVEPAGEPHPATIGEQDHENIDLYRGAETDAPEDTGRPADGETDEASL